MTKDGYEFQVRDRSVLLPLYARWIWNPLTNALPVWVSPNSITLASNAFSGLAYWLLLTMPHGNAAFLAAVSIANFVYFTLDNVDGRQARRTNTCSPLGEFLDHWFDAWNIGLLVFSISLFFDATASLLLPVMVCCSLGFFLTYWEQYRTGCVQLGYIGANEGLTAVSLLFAVAAVVGESAIVQPLLFELSAWNIFCILMALGFVGVIASTFRRHPAAAWDGLGLACGHLLTAAWYLTGTISLAAAGTIMVLWHVSHTGRVISCRLLGRVYSSFDPLTMCVLIVALSCAALPASAGLRPAAVLVTTVLLGVRTAADALFTIQSLRKHNRAAPICKAA